MNFPKIEWLTKSLEQGRILRNVKNGMLIWRKSSEGVKPSEGVIVECNGVKIDADGMELSNDGLELYSLTLNGKKVIAEMDCLPEDFDVVDEFLGRVFCYAKAPGYFLVLEKEEDTYTVLEFSDMTEYDDWARVSTIKEEQLCDMFYKNHTIAVLKVDDGIEAVANLLKKMAVDV